MHSQLRMRGRNHPVRLLAVLKTWYQDEVVVTNPAPYRCNSIAR
jgi:hypothetical protein